METKTPANPGSKIEFVSRHGGELSNSELSIRYTHAVARYQAELAACQGLTPDELHDGYRTGTATNTAVTSEIE